MIQLVRSFLVGTFLPIAGIVLVALLQRALEFLAPHLSDRSVGFTNVSTLLQIVAVLTVFFACGFFGPRWVRGRAPVFWLLLPIVSLYALAISQAPDLYGIHIEAIRLTLLVHSTFLVPLLATVVGYVCFQGLHRTAAGALRG